LDQHGDVIGAGPSLDRTFARAANSLTEAGEQSGIVHSEFGFHVIMLERIISPHTASVEALRQKFSAEVYLRRARAVSDQLINAGRQRYAVRVESSFQEAAAQLQAAP
jgi:parvulin-like peptidyl-prolyl isomerase